MTMREYHTNITNGIVNDEMKAYAAERIAKLDADLAKRNSKPSKASIANEPVKAEIVAFITKRGEACLASAIGEACGVSTQKASVLCRQMVESGVLTSSEVKVPKVGKRVVYTLSK